MEETDISDTSDADDTERLGEKIFSLVEELDPLHANDITGELLPSVVTFLINIIDVPGCNISKSHFLCLYSSACIRAGMLLEMEPAALHQLLSDHRMLEVAVQKAQAALDTQNRTLST